MLPGMPVRKFAKDESSLEGTTSTEEISKPHLDDLTFKRMKNQDSKTATDDIKIDDYQEIDIVDADT